MRSFFNVGTILDDDDTVRLADGRESVSDKNSGAVLQHPFKRCLNYALTVHINRTGCFIENQYRWPPDDAARDRYALSLAPAKSRSSFSNER
jgi:hypothetical protein